MPRERLKVITGPDQYPFVEEYFVAAEEEIAGGNGINISIGEWVRSDPEQGSYYMYHPRSGDMLLVGVAVYHGFLRRRYPQLVGLPFVGTGFRSEPVVIDPDDIDLLSDDFFRKPYEQYRWLIEDGAHRERLVLEGNLWIQDKVAESARWVLCRVGTNPQLEDFFRKIEGGQNG